MINRENQWLCGADGECLIPMKMDVNTDNSIEKGKKGEKVTVSQDSGNNTTTNEESGVIDVTMIIEEDDKENSNIDINMRENDGIVIS